MTIPIWVLVLAAAGMLSLGLLVGIVAGVYFAIKACEWDDKLCPRQLL